MRLRDSDTQNVKYSTNALTIQTSNLKTTFNHRQEHSKECCALHKRWNTKHHNKFSNRGNWKYRQLKIAESPDNYSSTHKCKSRHKSCPEYSSYAREMMINPDPKPHSAAKKKTILSRLRSIWTVGRQATRIYWCLIYANRLKLGVVCKIREGRWWWVNKNRSSEMKK